MHEGLKCASGEPARPRLRSRSRPHAALEGQVVPQSVKLPLATTEDPNFKDGESYYAQEGDNFRGNAFPTVALTLRHGIMGQSEANDNHDVQHR